MMILVIFKETNTTLDISLMDHLIKKLLKILLLLRLRYQNKNQLGLSEDEGDNAIEYTRFRAGLEQGQNR